MNRSTSSSSCSSAVDDDSCINARVVRQSRRAIAATKMIDHPHWIDPTTCESDFAAAELEFMEAMQEYKLRSGRMFPTWSEVLEVLTSLGYEKPISP